MAYEHRCTWVQTDKISATLTEWEGFGWELVTASAAGTSKPMHYLYFRKEK